MKYLFIRSIIVFISCFFTSTGYAKEVTLPYKGLTLNADLELADGKKLNDGVILITHGALAHRDMEMLVYLRKLLNENGHSTLAINLSLGLDNRHGMYDCKITQKHHNHDSVNEIGIWLNWLKKQGAKNIVLLGHSRGGAQTALFASQHDSKLFKSVILMAPATRENTDAAAFKRRYGKQLGQILKRAKKLVMSGKSNTVLENTSLMICRDTPVTASTFVSYYGQSSNVDTPSLIPKIKKPVLVLVAGNDRVVVDLDRKIAPHVDGKRVQMKIIEGSGHLFRDLNTDDAVDAIIDYLDGI